MSNQTKNKGTLKTQLFAAISMLCIAGIALISATYAWFTFVSNPEVKDIDLYVKTTDELYLSPYHNFQMDPEHASYDDLTKPYLNPGLWFATITRDMIQNGIGGDTLQRQANSFPTEMLNASSIFTTSNQNFFTRELNLKGEPTDYVACDPLPAGGYVKFDLWAKSNNSGVVYLDGAAAAEGLRKSYVAAIETTGGVRITSDQNLKKYIENTVRIGFSTEAEGGAGVAPAAPRAVVWEPNAKGHLGASFGGPGGDLKLPTLAITKAEAIPDPYTLENMNVGGEGGKDLQVTFDYLTDETNFLQGAGPSLNPDKIGLFYLEGGRAVKFSVYIWVEGADADTVNNVANSYFRTLLTFGIETGATASWIK
ncbi:MAG: hypothetical protein FWE47_01905 [Oscillospiraceae bacterium]|nr:hypothetical protein [Oscillospiraceae bacterium]